MKQRLFYFLLAGAVVVTLLIGIGGYNWIVSQSPLQLLRGGGTVEPAAAMFVSKQAPVMVSLVVNPERLEALRQLATRPEERQRSRQELNQLKTSLLGSSGLDYQKDIRPWLGDEITLAVTSVDIDRNAANGQQPGYLMAIATKDAEKSRKFLQLLFSQTLAEQSLVTEQYKGVQLIWEQPATAASTSGLTKPSSEENVPGLSGAVVGDRFVLFANYPKVLREAINNVQALEFSLLDSKQYQQALELLPPQRIGMAFLNLPAVATWLGSQLETPAYNTQVIALELNQQGLLAETTLTATPNRDYPSAPALSQPVAALNYLPAITGFSLSGSDLSHLGSTNLSQLWAEVATELSGSGYDAISRLVNQPLAALQERWGINLEQDIFSWVQGEYALGMLPSAIKATPDWIFVAEKSDAAEPAISHLDAIATSNGFSVTPLPMGEQKIFAWTQLVTAPMSPAEPEQALLTLKAKVQGVHTTVGNYEIFTTSVEAMAAALNASKNGSLLTSPKFQTSLDVIPQPNQGYVYLDWQASREILERQLPILKLLEVAGKPFFSNLRSLTASSYDSEPGLLKGGILFRFNNRSK